MKKVFQNKASKIILPYIAILIGSFLLAISTYMFTIPAKFIPGGVTGLASMIETLTGFAASYTIILINIPLIIAATIYLKKIFVFRTVFGIIFLSGFLFLFNQIDLYKFNFIDQPIITALIAGGLSGIGIGLLLNVFASSGGAEVLSMLIQKKYSNLKVSNIIFIINAIVISCGALLYFFVAKMNIDQLIIILACSILQVFINSISIDLVVNGLHSAVKFEIISNKGNEIADALLKGMEYGVTLLESKGAYSYENQNYLIYIIPKNKISTFKNIVQNVDSNAFVCAINTREVMGKNFKERM